jgi:hypothetical protein
MNGMGFEGLSRDQLVPATPAIFLNLGRNVPSAGNGEKGQNGQPQMIQISHQPSQGGFITSASSGQDKKAQEMDKERNVKVKGAGDKEKEVSGKGRGSATNVISSIATSRPRRGTAGCAGISPGLKAILPGSFSLLMLPCHSVD